MEKMARFGWTFICGIHNVLGTTSDNSTSPVTTSSTTPAVSETDTSSSSYIVEVVIVGCAILLLLIATMKIGFLLRSSSSQRRREDIDPVQCAVCSVRQGVPRSANIFICFSCKSANFVQRDSNGVTRPFSPSPTATGRSVTLRRVTDTFYRVDSDPEAGPKDPNSPARDGTVEQEVPHVPDEITDPPILSPRQEPVAPVDSDPGQCTICMDEPADTVLRPCNHGGIGYKCADALVRRSLLTGGACCPQCRTQISSLIKLSEMSDQVAKGFEIEIPKAFVMRRRVSSTS